MRKCYKEFNQKSQMTRHGNTCMIVSNIQENDVIINNIEIIIYDNKLVKDMHTKKYIYPKPILKWVGGKSQIIDKLIADFPIQNILMIKYIF
jgi:hypothetical protein